MSGEESWPRQGGGASGASKEPAPDSFREAVSREWLPFAICAGLTKEQLGNFQCWMTGIYFTHALACAFSQNSSYPEAPFELFPEKISEEERSRRDAELFSAYVSEYNSQIKKEEK